MTKIRAKQIPWRFWEKEKKDSHIAVRSDIEMLESIRQRYKGDLILQKYFSCIIDTLKKVYR